MLSEEELQLKARLDRVLGQINAAPPPVAAVLRKGRTMRTGYNLAISTAVAAVSLAGFAGIAQLGHLHEHQAATGMPGRHNPHWTKERIVRLGPVAKHGLVAEGTVAGRHRQATWRIRVDARHNQVDAKLTGSGAWYVGNLKRSVNPGSIGTFYSWYIDGWRGVYGVVSKDVTRIAVAMANHQKLNLYPVAAAGRHWVGLMVAPGNRALTFTAYSGKRQIAHAISLSGPVTWLLPGQHGLASRNDTVAGGIPPTGSDQLRWTLDALAGPFGYCLILDGIHGHHGFGIQDCMSPDTAESAGLKVVMHSVPPKLARWLVGTAKPSVSYLKFDLAGGKARRAEAVLVDGQRFFVLSLRPATQVTSWAAYDKAGHKLYGGTGSPKIDRYTGPLSAIGWADNAPCSLSTKACQRAHGSA